MLAEMVDVPASRVVANPAELTVATAGTDEVHDADCVTSRIEPSLNVATASNCCWYPALMLAADGVTAIETRVAPPTERLVELETEPSVAVTVVVPCPALVAIPELPVALLITATCADPVLHVTTDVTSCWLPSVYVPVAVYCCAVPSGIVAAWGLIAIVTRVAGFTTNVAVPFTPFRLIPIVVVPTPALVASPLVPGVLLIVPTVAAVELQCPACVTSCWLPSVYVPSAVNCCVCPSGMVPVPGLTAIDTSAAAVTVICVVPLTPPTLAVIPAVPTSTLVASPIVAAALLIVATLVVSDAHTAVLVTFCVLPSLNVPVAVYCCIVPSGIVGIPGVTAIDSSTAAVTVICVVPLTPPALAVIHAVPSPTLVANPAVAPPLTIVATLVVSVVHSTVAVMFCWLPSV